MAPFDFGNFLAASLAVRTAAVNAIRELWSRIFRGCKTISWKYMVSTGAQRHFKATIWLKNTLLLCMNANDFRRTFSRWRGRNKSPRRKKNEEKRTKIWFMKLGDLPGLGALLLVGWLQLCNLSTFECLAACHFNRPANECARDF